jgi:DNA-binding IclR family transcriptional regulator
MTASVQGTQSFARSIGLLQLIADAGEAPSRADLVKRSGLTRPTLYRIIASLEAEGLIEATGENRYRIGGRLVSLARTGLEQNDVRKVAEPFLTQLRNATGETVHLASRTGDELVYIDKIESQAAVRMISMIGTRVAFHSTAVGKAFLSAMQSSKADELINRIDLPELTQFTTTNREALRTIVRQAEQDGYVREDQENEIGIVCFGAAIVQAIDHPVASISVSVPLFRLDDAQRYTAPLMDAVAEISKRLGYINFA